MRLGLEAGRYTLDLAVELGIKGVPISADQMVNDGVERTLASLRERGLQVCQVGAFGFNPLSTDQEGQARQRQMIEQAIPLAARTGCPYIVINGGNHHPSGFGAGDRRNDEPQALDRLAEGLAPLLTLAAKHGLNLTIEPYLKTVINSPERFLALQERVQSNHLRVNIDVTSLYDYWDLWDPRQKVEHVCTALAGHYGLGHIKEIALLEGFHIHCGLVPLGKGSTDWSQVLRLMAAHLPEDSWVILEHVLSPEEGRASLALLKACSREAGVVLE